MDYPKTKRSDHVDSYFGDPVPDPYRWLEDDLSAETAEWVRAQNGTTSAYLSRITYRDAIRQRLAVMWDYEKVSAPTSEGTCTYYYRNDGLQNQDVLYQVDAEGNELVFLDPNTFSEDGTTSLSSISFSRDGSLAAYAISEGGSDWRKVIVISTSDQIQLEEALENIKFSGISWHGNEGFYYSSYDKPDGSELSAKVDQHKLYYHRLGQPQSEDQLIYGSGEDEKRRYIHGWTTEDDRYLEIAGAQNTSGNDLKVVDLISGANTPSVVLTDMEADTTLLCNDGTVLYFQTNHDAPNGRVVSADASDPGPKNWQDVIPETEHVLTATTGGGYLFASYMVDAMSRCYQYDMQGELVREIELPGLGTATPPHGKEKDRTLYYVFTNTVTPETILALDVETGATEVHRHSAVSFEPSNYETRQVFFESSDGTRVPMTISHKKGLRRDGSNPTMLYGYGGFNNSLTPAFSVGTAVWMSLGGIYAVPNIRGGGEYGKQWHLAGTRQKKQNVFNDFIAAGEFLIKEGYTSNQKLVLRGGSNGGLLVGAVMTQRPDLMAVALPAVGVMDMLRYHKFTAGAGWAYDYGTSEDDQEMYACLKGYSPLHNLAPGRSYPATLVTTSDHDDRVVPAHSFKFAAQLQYAQGGDEPVLIRIETDAGHGMGKPVDKILDELADLYAFTLFNMGVETLAER